jgi:uncharacterized membrane protein
MIYIVGKYVLWGLLCLPLVILVFYAFSDLMGDILNIHRETVDRKKELEKERRRRRLFEDEYRQRHR